ncbi:MAG: hypothetical protein K6E97_08020 [Treponema sp.]|jgi:hypothetical protein|nr:hypothetical protein [Treponema sp.]
MSWAPGTFKKLNNNECCDFLLSYLNNINHPKNLSDAYKNVLHYIIGSIMITDDFRIISKKANEILKKNNIEKLNTSKSYKKKYGLILEHTIPVSCVTDYLLKLKETKNLQEKKLLQLLTIIRGIALITVEEDDLLTKTGLKSALPKDCSIDLLLEDNSKVPFDIRYKTAKIDY